jgi:hypothetical protein
VLERTAYVYDAYIVGSTEATTAYFCKTGGFAARKETCGVGAGAVRFNWEKMMCDPNTSTPLDRCGVDNKLPTGDPALTADPTLISTKFPPALAIGGLDANTNPGGYSTDGQFCFTYITNYNPATPTVAPTRLVQYVLPKCNNQEFEYGQVCASPIDNTVDLGAGLGVSRKIDIAQCINGTELPTGETLAGIWLRSLEHTWTCVQTNKIGPVDEEAACKAHPEADWDGSDCECDDPSLTWTFTTPYGTCEE